MFYLFQGYLGYLLKFARSFPCKMTSLLNPTILRKSANENYVFGGQTLERSLRFPDSVGLPLGVRKVAQLMLGSQLNFDAAVTCL